MSIDLPSLFTADVVRLSGGAKQQPVFKGVSDRAVRQGVSSAGNIIPTDQVAKQLPEESRLSSAVSRLNNHIQQVSRELEFTIDKELDRVIIKVYNTDTKEVLRQIPAEEVLSLARHLASDDSVILSAKA